MVNREPTATRKESVLLKHFFTRTAHEFSYIEILFTAVPAMAPLYYGDWSFIAASFGVNVVDIINSTIMTASGFCSELAFKNLRIKAFRR